MPAVPLRQAEETALHGGKAVQLGTALRAGLPVPDGIALSWQAVDAFVAGDGGVRESVLAAVTALEGPVAVRSSAVDEDSAQASFAGQHATKLAMRGTGQVLSAIEEVWASGRTDSALAYRRRVGADGEPRVAVVVQRLVAADVAGVLFTCNPVTGEDEIVIEAGWGLGEVVVQGMVVPDRFRIGRCGTVRERTPGAKPVALRMAGEGGTFQEDVPPILQRRLCLGYPELRALHGLAARCDGVFGEGPHDLEWAMQGGALFLLQRRPVTRGAAQAG